MTLSFEALLFPLVGNPSLQEGKDSGQAGMTANMVNSFC
jgi:hypothetical protein